MTDQEILIKLNSGNTSQQNEAFEAIYLEVYPLIRNFILKNNGSEETSLDLFQDAMVIFYNHIRERRFQGASSVSTYVFGISRNLWRAYLRKESKTIQLEEISQLERVLVSDEQIELAGVSSVVHRLLGELGENCRKILYMYYFENRSMMEVKEYFDLGSDQAAKTKKYRCMQQLIRLFRKHKITPESILDFKG